MRKSFISVLFMAIFAIGFVSSSDDKSDANASSGDSSAVSSDIVNEGKEDVVSRKVVSQIKDVEELRQAINNTVWTHTAHGDQWLRYEFVGNTVKQYSALPHSGEWKYDGESLFELSEMRSHNDGKRFITASFMPQTESLAMFELPVVFNFRDYHLYLNGTDMGGFVMADYDWD